MYNHRQLTFVASLVALAAVCASAHAQDTSEPTAETKPPSAEVAPSSAPTAPNAAEPAPTTAAPEPEAAPQSTPVKWRPLVLRSEIPPEQRPIFGTFKGTYLMVGPHVGMGLTVASLILGGEVSLVHQTTEFGWFGAYVDGVRDFGREQTRFSVGPELGWSAFGLDAGYLLSSTPSGVHHGITVRPLVSMGYATLFGRFTKDLTSDTRVWAELGVLLKYPIQL